MILIIPIAGKGSRFQSQYDIPKPFLKITNTNSKETPMYIEAIKTFTNKELVDDIVIISLEIYNEYFENDDKTQAHKIFLKDYTEGQAQTCYYATSLEKYNEPIIISACDNSAIYDHKSFLDIVNEKNTDIVIWTFNTEELDKSCLENTYSWAQIDSDSNKIVKVYTKCMPPNDALYNCKPIVGTFYFKNNKYYNDGYEYTCINNIRSNDEFYIENMFNYLIEKQLVIKNFTIDKYIGWGIPEDYAKNKLL
jgi:hypothetical protein